ncbi:glycosyltransferase family 2 protein [Lutimonas sp.]|uniref:glycosyltransferase family 2 protein n=1 Tax=Lutimonas sp. TaxID=1872403 RepID=UPI003D9B9A10
MIRISVIIVNYNARFFLENCLCSVLSSEVADLIEIIVVDNASNDDSCSMISNSFPDIQLIRNAENVGFAKANNQAVKMAQGDYILILNPDTMLAETTLSDMLAFAEGQENFGAAGLRFIDGTGSYLPESKRNFPNLMVAGAKLLGYSNSYYANHLDHKAVGPVEILTGAFMFVRKEVYNTIGGFDEDFFMYGEDIDLSYRILRAGYQNFYIGTSSVLHFKGESTVKDKFYVENFYGALRIFYKKHFSNRAGLYMLVDVLIKTMISLKSLSGSQKASRKEGVKAWAYMGKDAKVYERLKGLFVSIPSVSVTHMEATGSEGQVVLFDSKTLKYAEIIEAMARPDLSEVRKRIISQNQEFYIGSDASNEQGEAVTF